MRAGTRVLRVSLKTWVSFMTEPKNILNRFNCTTSTLVQFVIELHAFLFRSNTFISNTRLKIAKNLATFKQNAEVRFVVLILSNNTPPSKLLPHLIATDEIWKNSTSLLTKSEIISISWSQYQTLIVKAYYSKKSRSIILK